MYTVIVCTKNQKLFGGLRNNPSQKKLGPTCDIWVFHGTDRGFSILIICYAGSSITDSQRFGGTYCLHPQGSRSFRKSTADCYMKERSVSDAGEN
jgi:hypothetical protein